jgi:hypothetical protein
LALPISRGLSPATAQVPANTDMVINLSRYSSGVGGLEKGWGLLRSRDDRRGAPGARLGERPSASRFGRCRPLPEIADHLPRPCRSPSAGGAKLRLPRPAPICAPDSRNGQQKRRNQIAHAELGRGAMERKMYRKPGKEGNLLRRAQAEDHRPAKHIEETARLASSNDPNKNPEKVRKTKD